jgi:predicted amidophosphoribosyltransferase
MQPCTSVGHVSLELRQTRTLRAPRRATLLPATRPSLMSNSTSSAFRFVARSGRALIRLLAPDNCAACDAPVEAEQSFCESCGPCPAPPSELKLDGCWVAGTYAPPLSTAILRFKFSQRADLARPLARLLPWPFEPGGVLCVAPVPLHRARLIERGFNPAGLLARELSRRVGAKYSPLLLQRLRDTPQQARLSVEERRLNVVDAFALRARTVGGETVPRETVPRETVPRETVPRRVVLVDDVVTTGSTVEACSRALYSAGVVHVSVIALAAPALP